MRLSYVMKFVADMDAAVAFYRDKVGLALRFQSPEWSEFETGETTLALHKANATHPAGACQVGLKAEDLDAFYETARASGVEFTRPPTAEQWVRIADFRDCDGAEVSVSG